VKKRFLVSIGFLVAVGVPALFAQASSVTDTVSIPVIKYIAAALAVGFSTLAGGIAVGQIGAAAMAAMSENPDLSGKAIPFVGLAEGICLWGFIVALMILSS
jgi:V/A-type H+-transporting ATPase subunit K